MAKDPAFLFYPGDWLSGTMYLTHEQKGAYIDLLILQFNVGSFNEAQAKQVLSICFDVAWPMLKQKFTLLDGLYFNERLKSEIEKRKSFSESRRNNAKGTKKRKSDNSEQEASAEHMLQHMEDENIIIDNTVVTNSIMQFFNFNEIANFDKLRDSSTFVNVLSRNKTLSSFVKQFDAYQKLKGKGSKFTHSFKNFLGTAKELYLDGAWNSENWVAKLPKDESPIVTSSGFVAPIGTSKFTF